MQTETDRWYLIPEELEMVCDPNPDEFRKSMRRLIEQCKVDGESRMEIYFTVIELRRIRHANKNSKN